MSDFRRWCTVGTPVPTGGHLAGLIESHDDATGVTTIAPGLPTTYTKSSALAHIAERMGKDAVAEFLRNKLPTSASAPSGDMRIIATAYLHEEQGSVVGPSRLIDRRPIETDAGTQDAIDTVVRAVKAGR